MNRLAKRIAAMPLIGMVLITACTAPEDRPVRPIPAAARACWRARRRRRSTRRLPSSPAAVARTFARGSAAPPCPTW